jgi:cysteine-S-conjugate beta-lyase
MRNPLEELTLAQLQQRTSAKWRAYPADVLPMWVAEMDVMPAAPIVTALQHALEIGDTGYSMGHAYPEAVRRFAAQRWDWPDFPARFTRSVPDVMMGITEVLRLVTEPGDPVVVNSPVYPPFYAFVTSAGRTVVESALTQDWRLDIEQLEATFRELTSAHPHVAYLMSSPHNPSGTVHTAEELAAVGRAADRYGVRVIVDEIHAPLVLPGATFVPYLSLPDTQSGFSVMSASKAWNLAGLKAALAVPGEQARDDLARMPEEVGHGASHLGVIAHTAAFSEGGSWLDAVLAGLDSNRWYLSELLTDLLPELLYEPGDATYLAWIDCRALRLHSPDRQGPGIVSDLEGPAKFFLDQARVALSSGHVFGSGGSGYVRMNFATSQGILTDAVERMHDAVRTLRRSRTQG